MGVCWRTAIPLSHHPDNYNSFLTGLSMSLLPSAPVHFLPSKILFKSLIRSHHPSVYSNHTKNKIQPPIKSFQGPADLVQLSLLLLSAQLNLFQPHFPSASGLHHFPLYLNHMVPGASQDFLSSFRSQMAERGIP